MQVKQELPAETADLARAHQAFSRALRRLGYEWTQVLGARTATGWRVWKLRAQEVIDAILNTSAWRDWDWRAVLRARAEPKRMRQLQVVPPAVAQWLKASPLVAFRRAV